MPPVNPVSLPDPRQPASPLPSARQDAQQLLAAHRTAVGIDTPGLARDLAALRARDPAGADAVAKAVSQQLTPVERGNLARAQDQESAPAKAPLAANDTGPDPTQLALDLGQMGLDIAGIFDPTPISDGGNALVSVGRSLGALFSGDFDGAGEHALNAGISTISIIPAVGDLAKAGKFGKWAETVSEAVSAVMHNPALRGALEPALKKLAGVLDKIPESAINALPDSARDAIVGMKKKLTEGLEPPQAGSAGKTLHTGAARVLDPANPAHWDAAEKAYDTIRATRGDIDKIAASSGMSKAEIAQIKDHLFNATHKLDGGTVARFDAHPEIVNAWNRLTEGTNVQPKDLQLLKHELFEAKYEKAHGSDYRTAHQAANEAGFPSGLE